VRLPFDYNSQWLAGGVFQGNAEVDALHRIGSLENVVPDLISLPSRLSLPCWLSVMRVWIRLS